VKPNSEFLLQLFSVYLGFDVIGVTITILLLPTLPLSNWIKKKSVLKSIYSMISSLSNAFRGGDSNEKGYQTDDARQVITRTHMAFG
jgi:hypothetical protein